VERFGKISGMIETAENLARDYGSARAGRRLCLRSHQRRPPPGRRALCRRNRPGAGAAAQGRAHPVQPGRGFRADATPESLAKLRVLMPNGTVTAGNASQQNDAAPPA
jgi:acetyl-CoA C-acetyltransferase